MSKLPIKYSFSTVITIFSSNVSVWGRLGTHGDVGGRYGDVGGQNGSGMPILQRSSAYLRLSFDIWLRESNKEICIMATPFRGDQLDHTEKNYTRWNARIFEDFGTICEYLLSKRALKNRYRTNVNCWGCMYAAENPFSMDEYYHFLDETRRVRFIAHGMWSFFWGTDGDVWGHWGTAGADTKPKFTIFLKRIRKWSLKNYQTLGSFLAPKLLLERLSNMGPRIKPFPRHSVFRIFVFLEVLRKTLQRCHTTIFLDRIFIGTSQNNHTSRKWRLPRWKYTSGFVLVEIPCPQSSPKCPPTSPSRPCRQSWEL